MRRLSFLVLGSPDWRGLFVYLLSVVAALVAVGTNVVVALADSASDDRTAILGFIDDWLSDSAFTIGTIILLASARVFLGVGLKPVDLQSGKHWLRTTSSVGLVGFTYCVGFIPGLSQLENGYASILPVALAAIAVLTIHLLGWTNATASQGTGS